MRDHILLYVNGKRHEIRGAAIFQPLSTFLRETLALTGAKIVCAEGDCGSCTVLFGRAAAAGKMESRPVCSCIQYLCQLDCTHIITVEGLSYDNAPNPVQESFCRHHGAQCGFCTPGFVVVTCALLDANPKPTDAELRRGLVGNLCRCTGYEPILKAGLDVAPASLRKIDSLFDTPAITHDLLDRQRDTVHIHAPGQLLFKPATLAEAAAFHAAHPDCLLLAGGTDIGVQANKGKREFTTVMSLAALDELCGVSLIDSAIVAGACCSLADLEDVAASALPEMARMLERFGSPPIRNAGTLGGNIGNSSPIGDTMPALFALNARIELVSTRGSRQVNINDFYTGYRKSVLAPDELITRVTIPLPAPGELFRIYKVSKRLDLDISTFAVAIWIRLVPHASSNGNGSPPNSPAIDDIRIAFGGVAPVILRLTKTEASLRGAPLIESSFLAAGRIARDEIRPISDVRGGGDYRLELAENTFARFFADVSPALALAAGGRP